jgi:hypothetical protein
LSAKCESTLHHIRRRSSGRPSRLGDQALDRIADPLNCPYAGRLPRYGVEGSWGRIPETGKALSYREAV